MEKGKALFEEISKGKRYILKDMVYEIEVEKDSFLSRNQISTINEENSKRFLEEVYLIPIVDESGEAAVIDFPEVQYALDKAELLIDDNVNSEDSLDFYILHLWITLILLLNFKLIQIVEGQINTIKNYLKEEPSLVLIILFLKEFLKKEWCLLVMVRIDQGWKV